MKKERFMDFIKRYHLGGKIESVVWKVENETLFVKFVAVDRSMLGMLQLKDFDGISDEVSLGVLTTSQLIKLLDFVGEDINISLDKVDQGDEIKVTSMKLLSKGNRRANFMLADLAVIPKPKNIKTMPTFGVSLNISKTDIDDFNKGKAALPDTKSFTMVKNPKTDKYELVIGYSSQATNTAYLPVEYTSTEDIDRPISFSADFFKEILTANKTANSITANISNDGLCHVNVKDGDFDIDYYLAEIEPDL